ncbi:MAG: translation elongation factor Ts [Pseudomonadales bacterium]
MATITAALVKELRERTGLGMMDCKNALVKAAGDMELAIDNLRKTSALKAARKSGRTTVNGLLGLRVGDDAKRAALVEINIETDFAAKNEKFVEFVNKITDRVFDDGETDVDKLMQSGLDDEREALVQEIGENIQVRRAAVLSTESGVIGSYLHSDKRQGALVELTGGDERLGRDLAMQVTAVSPMVVSPEDVPEKTRAKEREIFEAQAQDSDKPAEIVAKMVDGRLRKFLAEVSLTEQPFVKDPKIKVGALLEQANAACKQLVRFQVGEGMVKVEEDFASEVAAQLKHD